MNSIMSLVCCVPTELIENLSFEDENSGRNAVYIQDGKTRSLNNHEDNLTGLLDLHQDDDTACLNTADKKNEDIIESRPQYSSEEEKHEETKDYIEAEKYFNCHHPHESQEENKDGREEVHHPLNKRIPFGLDQSYHNGSVSVATENMRCFQEVNNQHSNKINTSLNNHLKYLSNEKENELKEEEKNYVEKNCFQIDKSQFLNKMDSNRSRQIAPPKKLSTLVKLALLKSEMTERKQDLIDSSKTNIDLSFRKNLAARVSLDSESVIASRVGLSSESVLCALKSTQKKIKSLKT